MEIHIRLAGIQLGPYSEKQVREYLEEGLLAPTDPAREDGTENWIPVNELLSRLQPAADGTDAPPEPISEIDEIIEAPKRAPNAAPGVTHLPQRHQDSKKVSLPAVVDALSKKTMLIGPTAPTGPAPSGRTSYSTVTTSPLTQTPQGTKKMSRAELVKALAQKTAPLPSRPIPPPPAPPSSLVPPARDAVSPAQQDGKKPVPPSLLKSLTAKTVPMRSAPQSPPSPVTLPITEPLPTKPVFKPASGSVPPPSAIHALTKRLGQVPPLGSTLTSPPTSGLPVETTGLPSSRSPGTATAPAGLEPVEEPAAPPAPRRILSKVIYVCLAASLLLAYYVWSPYHAASSLWNALKNGDPAELAAVIDFPSVRASLKEQIKDQSVPSNSSGAPLALAMLDHSIDLYVTPEGISALVKNPDTFSKDDLAVSPEAAAKLLLDFNSQPVRSQGLASLDDFALQMDATLLHLQLQGMGWKLKRIDLRPDLRTLLSSANAASSPGSGSPLISSVVDTFMDRGDAMLKKSDWTGAISEYTKVLAINPRSSTAYNLRGNARESKGDLDGAIKDYTQAIAIDPQMAAAYDGRGNAKATKNDLDGAIADYTRAVTIDPNLATAYDSRGNAKTAKDDLDGAIADFTQAITIDPKQASAYSDRGFARQANGNLDGAISDYTQALALKPKTASAYYNRGLARLSQGSLEVAIVDFDRALAFDPKIAEAYYNRGNAKNALHDLDGAIADYTQAVALNPKIALAYSNRGLARQAKGDLDAALGDYTRALAIDSKIAVAYYNRGVIEAQKNDLDAAIADSSQALYLDPKNAQAYYNRGFAKLIKGNLEGATGDLKQFCDTAPRDHNADHARLYLWLIAKAQNSKADADQQLSDALENSWNSAPDDMVSRTAAFLLGRTNEADYLAAAGSPDAKTLQSQQCETWYFSGMKRLLMGDKTTAIDYFHKCVATGQKDQSEYLLAQAELSGLEPNGPPTPAAAAVPAKLP